MAQIVQEFISEALTLVGSGDKTGDVEELDGNRAATVLARTVVGLASI
jgi:hypothetical protein